MRLREPGPVRWAITESRGAFVRPSAPLVTQPLLGAQNQEAHVIGEPLARELSQVALERS
jgi:hypothetical protein